MRGAQQKKSKRLKRKSLVKPTPPGSRPLEKIINQWARKIKDFQDVQDGTLEAFLRDACRCRWPIKCCQPYPHQNVAISSSAMAGRRSAGLSLKRRMTRSTRSVLPMALVALIALGGLQGAWSQNAQVTQLHGSGTTNVRQDTHTYTTPAPPPARETIRGARIFDL